MELLEDIFIRCGRCGQVIGIHKKAVEFETSVYDHGDNGIGSKKNHSYYCFLKAINEDDIPSFTITQEKFINYVSDMLPVVRPYEYLIIQKLIEGAGHVKKTELCEYLKIHCMGFSQDSFDHALKYMLDEPYLTEQNDLLMLDSALFDIEFEEYMKDLLKYGLEKYDIDFGDKPVGDQFNLWCSYRKAQIMQLLLRDPEAIQKGTLIENEVVYAFVTVMKDERIKDTLDYDDGYIDHDTFQWESVAHVKTSELEKLKNANGMHIFVRKVEKEDGITLPFTYIGKGKPYYMTGPKENGAHLFRVEMENTAPEDVYFDFKLRKLNLLTK